MKSSAQYMGQIMTHIGALWSKQSASSAIIAPPDAPMQGENSAKYELLAPARTQSPAHAHTLQGVGQVLARPGWSSTARTLQLVYRSMLSNNGALRTTFASIRLHNHY
jgi:hypothetical protein